MHYNPAHPCPQGTAALVEFTAGDVPGRYQDLVQRYAVLVPLFGTEAVEPEPVPSLTLKLVDHWRRRVMELAEAGLPGLAGDDAKAWQARKYAMNCLPTFAIVPQRTRCCRLRELCPFCWAREVGETWEKIDRAFFAPTGGKGPERYNMIELAVEDTFRLQIQPDHPQDGQPGNQVLETLPRYFAMRISKRGVELKDKFFFKGVLGGYETMHVGVKDEMWRVSLRRILMVAADVEQPDVPQSGNIRYRFHGHPTRREVMHAVAGACRYPTFLLRGDAGLVVRYLAARKGRKLSAMTGMFRNGKAGGVATDPAPLT